MRKTDFFIVGQTRSGTTTILYLLKQHPDVFIIHSGTGKIPPRFGFPPTKITEEEYLKAFSEAKNNQILGDKCSDYMMCSTSAERIREFNPDAKIIINLRNPIDCMHSLHTFELNNAVETIDDFEKALEAEEERTKEELETPNKYNHNLFYRKNMKYVEQVQRYFDAFGKENVLVRIFDDFTSEPEKSFREVCKFLNIDPNFKPTFGRYNANRATRNKFIQKSVVKTNNTKFRDIVRKIPGIQDFYNFVNLPEVERDEINPDFKKKLQKDMKPEIEKLSNLIEKDLTKWYTN
ncbi:sulfotransferase family protein [Nitrosopumilus sp.]|uniref:sulfotransferase family protein n=1 Tax=Nitrosopumilus sp. TaxID=2024843 RepID=UPI003D0BDA72